MIDVDFLIERCLHFAHPHFLPHPNLFQCVEVRGRKLASGDPSEMPEWHLTSNWVCSWPQRTELNNGRHVPPCPRHHGNTRPFGEVARGVLGSKLSLYPDQCNGCCMWIGKNITHLPQKRDLGWLFNLCRQLWWCFIFSQSPGEILQFI